MYQKEREEKMGYLKIVDAKSYLPQERIENKQIEKIIFL